MQMEKIMLLYEALYVWTSRHFQMVLAIKAGEFSSCCLETASLWLLFMLVSH